MNGYKIFFKSVKEGYLADKKSFLISIVNSILTSSWSFITTGSFAIIVNELAKSLGEGTEVNWNSIYFSIFLIVISNLIPNVADIYDQFIGDRLFRNIDLFLRMKWLEKMGTFDIGIIEGKKFQDLSQKINDRGIFSIRSLDSWFFVNMANFIRLFTASIIFLKYDYRLTVLAIVSVVPDFFIERETGKETFELWDKEIEKKRQINSKQTHFLNPNLLTELKLLLKTKFYARKIYSFHKDFNDQTDRINKKTFKLKLMGEIVSAACLVFSMYLIVKLTIDGKILVGTMLFVYSAFNTFQYSAGNVFRSLGRIREHIKFATDYYDFFKITPLVREDVGDKLGDEEKCDIVFEKVNFKYPETEKLVLKNISLEIKEGERVAIVGENGASKTTLIKLLSKMYIPESGKITVAGKNLSEIQTKSWQEKLSFMTQDYAMYSDTIKDQIAYGAKGDPTKVPMSSIINVAKKAHALDFIEKLPKKFDQVIGRSFTDGVELSRGQNQKIALARFLLRDSKVLILDEPTSAIDAIAESKIFNELFEEERGRTLIIISHRFNTVKRADKIIVLEEGKIVEIGTHDELVKNGKKYAEMYNAQAKEYQE